jgi:indolepyruvate ferredoxin oxidoreductase
VAGLTPANHATAIGLAALPAKIRGFGHVKARNLEAVKKEEADLLARFRSSEPVLAQAAE